MAFIHAFCKPQRHWPRNPPSPLLSQSGGEERAAGVSPREFPPVPPHRFSKISDYHLIILINRVDADSNTSWIQRNLILEQHKPTAQHQRSAARKGSNTQHNNRTNTTSASRSPTKHHPRTARHAHPPTKPSTDQAIHPPCYSSTAPNGCVVSYSNFARAGRYTAERSK